MSFVNNDLAARTSALQAAHYGFPRGERLREAMSWALTDYYGKRSLSKPFEARGLLVTGPSRIGKSTEIRKLLCEVNDGSTLMPDGRPAKIASVILNGSLTWKDLGMHTLNNGLHYPATGRLTQRQVWDRVLVQAKLQGVIGIHYDECQHIFSNSADARAKTLDSFKSLLKQSEWPLVLILSGVGSLVHHIVSEEQLAYLLKPVTFKAISKSSTDDLQELHALCHAYAAKASIEFGTLASRDFYERLATACALRWGLVVELLIEALVLAGQQKSIHMTRKHFCEAFTSRLELRPGYSPFSIDDYEVLFTPEKIFEIWERDDED